VITYLVCLKDVRTLTDRSCGRRFQTSLRSMVWLNPFQTIASAQLNVTIDSKLATRSCDGSNPSTICCWTTLFPFLVVIAIKKRAVLRAKEVETTIRENVSCSIRNTDLKPMIENNQVKVYRAAVWPQKLFEGYVVDVR